MKKYVSNKYLKFKIFDDFLNNDYVIRKNKTNYENMKLENIIKRLNEIKESKIDTYIRRHNIEYQIGIE